MTVIGVIVALIVAVAAAAAGYFIGYNNRKKTAEAQIGSAEAEATRLVNEAIKTADQKRKEAILEAKDEAFRLKAEVDAQKQRPIKRIKQRRAEISRQENPHRPEGNCPRPQDRGSGKRRGRAEKEARGGRSPSGRGRMPAAPRRWSVWKRWPA